MQFALDTKLSTQVEVLRLSGRFDAFEEPTVKQWLEDQRMAGVSQIVINLEDVNFLDSVALARLVQGMKECRQLQGDLHLCGLGQPVQIIFELTRMDKVFSIYETEKEAQDMKQKYTDDNFEVEILEEDQKFLLFTRRVVTEIVLEGDPGV